MIHGKKLARENGLEGFYFVGKSDKGRLRQEILDFGYDAVYNDAVLNVHHHQTLIYKILLEFRARFLKYPKIFKYKDAIKYMFSDAEKAENAIPVIAPNWDHTPRSGTRASYYMIANLNISRNL